MAVKKTTLEKNLWQRLPARWRFIFVFVALLAASYTFRHFFPLTPNLREGQRAVNVKEFVVDTVFENPAEVQASVVDALREDKTLKEAARKAKVSGIYVSKLIETGREIKLAYREFLPQEGTLGQETRQKIPNALPVVLIHGTAKDGASLNAIAEELIRQGTPRVIVPDMPGAGASQRVIKDYSIEASAGTIFSLLDELKIEQANVLGFGNGGGIAIYMGHQQPERIKSLALVSSVGAQEFELLGNHIVNKIVYTFHLGFFKLLEDIFPHFGLLDIGNINEAYARTLWDSDISDLKRYIHEWNGPLFLAHGKGDLVSPFASAEYSAALAPQAVTCFVDGGHSVFLNQAQLLTSNYTNFLRKTHEDIGKTENAKPRGNADYYPPIEAASGMRIFVLMFIIIVCTFVAEDPTCLASGLLVAQGLIDFVPAMLACLIGIFIGDLVLYLIGRFLGRAILKKAPFKWIVSEQQIDEMSDRFSKNPKGLALIVSSRFIPGSRVPTFIAAGIMKLDWHKLIFLFFIAAALWTPPLILIAEKVGAGVIEQFKEWHHNAAWIVIGAILALYLLTHYIIPAFTWRGRRRHVMTRHHITRHEYWPRIVLFVPVMFQFLWLALIHRSFTLFTLANPGLGENGGLPAGSKLESYNKFLHGNTSCSIKTFAVPAEKEIKLRFEKTRELMRNNTIEFPCIIKPEIGDGGIGVCIVKNEQHLKNWLEANPDDAILQEFIRGNEYEVIWSRRPGRKEGRIQSVVQKDLVSIKGDGERSLEDLIWAHDKGVSNGALFTKLNFRNAHKILRAGEMFPLAPIGSRIKGARFISRPELRTGKLSKIIDDIADKCGNVHYVCLDIRAENDDDLLDGNAIKITSVKGAGSFASTCFDGYVRLGKAYARIYKQLNFCFTVGAELKEERGLTPKLSPFRLFELWGTARGRSDNYVKESD